jgi:hypothetical protein
MQSTVREGPHGLSEDAAADAFAAFGTVEDAVGGGMCEQDVDIRGDAVV